jgi:hypothetical protein
MELDKNRRIPKAIGALWCLVPLAAGCEHRDPPAWDAGAGSLSAQPLPPPPPSPDAAAATSDAEAAPDAPPVDPGTLPQTRDRPRSSDPAYQARMRTLWEAIVTDDPDHATPSFFPVSAYKQVKAIPSPETDWKRRLVAAFARDIHRLHQQLGRRAADATLVELEVASERARWVEPGEESNKVGYWRVYGSKLRYQVGDTAAAFDVSSLISWRGEWYIVHLSGFK